MQTVQHSIMKTPLIFTSERSKVRQLADALNQAITNREYTTGDSLPSINQLSKSYEVSRDTVFKAFGILKTQGIVDSTPAKGYYVNHPENRVLLLLDTYSPFKSELYNALTQTLPLNYKIDLYFHQYNKERFNKLIAESVDRYNLYLVMNDSDTRYADVLNQLDPNKLMLIDFGNFEKEPFAYVCQRFDTTLYDCLCEGRELLAKYEKLVFVFPKSSEHPRSCKPYFEKFCRDFGFRFQYAEDMTSRGIESGTAYLIIHHNHLIEAIKQARQKGYQPGKEVGFLAFNDEPVFEILDQGITVISTDFRAMGAIAAEFIRTRKKIQTYIPTRLIIRGSL